ncbi:hypothetical protein [Kineosporia babensis]|uniref:Uncharacterized protein n=1 Tax=Kineosporia babensis TaxID=499548 RepID=A0A9X1T4I4_9ACTN|nr:hypothetical protein [Kineosporia babensis]MCD5316648.1 hypothetical protein [Kineosporia babensis]
MHVRSSLLLSAAAVCAVAYGAAVVLTQSPDEIPTAAQSSPVPSASANPHGYESILIEGRAVVASPDEVMRQDLDTYAEQHGQTFDETLQQFHGSTTFSELSNDIEADPHSGYVQSAWHSPDADKPWIRFTDKPSPAILLRIETEATGPVEVQWGAPLNATSLERVAQEIYGAVVNYPGVATATGGPESDGSIKIEYRLEPGATVNATQLRRAALRAGAKASPTKDVPVEVRLVDSPELQSSLK